MRERACNILRFGVRDGRIVRVGVFGSVGTLWRVVGIREEASGDIRIGRMTSVMRGRILVALGVTEFWKY